MRLLRIDRNAARATLATHANQRHDIPAATLNETLGLDNDLAEGSLEPTAQSVARVASARWMKHHRAEPAPAIGDLPARTSAALDASATYAVPGP
jgi:hypothetical protein